MHESAAKAFLICVAGPMLEPLPIQSTPRGSTLGRHETCELKLPENAAQVSRFHARFRFDSDMWRVVDLNSRWGTYVNGVKLSPEVEMPLVEGDLIRIDPWTFNLSRVADRAGVLSENDVGRTIIRTITQDAAPVREDLLALLLESSTLIYCAISEVELFERLMDAAIRGTWLNNAAVLRPLDSQGQFEVLGIRFPQGTSVGFSRSLLRSAAAGQAVELSTMGGDISQSIMQMNLTAAICVPLMLGSAVAAFLYLDSRSNNPGQAELKPLRWDSSAFAVALGRLASLALANLKRMEMERRQSWIESELRAAAAAQQWILPASQITVGPFLCIGQSRAGQQVGGDFFDVIDLGNGRLAIALGDVSGKGISASVLMTATQGFLHAALRSLNDAGKAVTALNRFIAPRRPGDRFVTLWVGLFDPIARELRYVDAGHGYALLIGSEITSLDLGGGPPLGVDDRFEYRDETIPLPKAGKLIVVSDGIVEQVGQIAPAAQLAAPERFEMAGVRRSIQQAHDSNDIARLFDDVIHYAGTDHLADDATGVMVLWKE